MDIDVAPAHRFADAGAERLRDRLFRGEARSEMARGKFHRLAISDLALREDAVEEALTETFERMLDPRRLDHVDANSEDAHPVLLLLILLMILLPSPLPFPKGLGQD